MTVPPGHTLPQRRVFLSSLCCLYFPHPSRQAQTVTGRTSAIGVRHPSVATSSQAERHGAGHQVMVRLEDGGWLLGSTSSCTKRSMSRKTWWAVVTVSSRCGPPSSPRIDEASWGERRGNQACCTDHGLFLCLSSLLLLSSLGISSTLLYSKPNSDPANNKALNRETITTGVFLCWAQTWSHSTDFTDWQTNGTL